MDETGAPRLAIIVEELVTNLYDHGNLGDEDAFEIVLSSDGNELRLLLIAAGPRFNPWLPRLPTQPSPSGAGAGLKLVKAWSSRLEHEHAEGANRLALTLPITSP